MTRKDKALAAAKKALDRGSLDKAISEYTIAAAEDPRDTRTWLKLAELYVKRGKKPAATDAYLKAADLYTEQGFFQRAVAVYKNILKLTPGYVEAHFKLADLFRQLGLLSDAMQQYELAAGVYQKEGKMDKALSAMRRIVDLNPDHVMSRIKLAEAATQAGLKDEAVEEFRRAAEHLKSLGKTDEYLRVSERLLIHTPEDYVLAKEMAEAYIDRGNARFALAKLQPCFNFNARDEKTLALLARAFEQLGHVAKTVSVLKELARVYREQGREEEGLTAYQKILVLDPDDIEARNESARAHRKSVPMPAVGQPAPRAASITFSEMAVPQFLLPRDSSISSSLPGLSSTGDLPAHSASTGHPTEGNLDVNRIISECDVFVKYALLERAADHLQRVFDIEPDHVGARERLAYVLLQLGRNAEAATQFAVLSEQFRKSDPQRSAEFTRHAVAARPRMDPDAITDPETELSFGGVGDDGEEILDVDEIGAEFIDDEPTSGDTGGGRAAHALSGTGEHLDGETRDSDWAPPTFAEMSMPDFAGFDRAERTHGDSAERTAVSDLDQADFLLQAGLLDEAATIVGDLLKSHPDNPAVRERRDRLVALRGGGGAGAFPPDKGTGGGTSARTLKGSPHAELGETYRDMGLYDAAIKEFTQLLSDPAHEVFALIGIGECHEKKASLTEAVIHYKKALNRSNVSEEETTQIYYSLGNVFEALGDIKEALFFFEKVRRRNPGHRDVGMRIARLKNTGT